MLRLARGALALCFLLGCRGAVDDRPNVVLVLLDTLRPDHLEAYGYAHPTSPYLNELGQRAAVFEKAFSTSGWTPPATASALTGLFPTNHGVVHGFETNERVQRDLDAGRAPTIPLVALPRDSRTLAEAFRAAGYRTYGATTNVHISEPIGFDRGFDHFEHARDADSDWVREVAGAWEDSWNDGRAPSFLYLHLNDVHRPYDPREPWYTPAEGAVEDDLARYDSEIRHVDENLRELARRFHWEKNTVVCVISDHGEAFGEHGLVGHGPSLNFSVNRVCFLLAGPGVPAGRHATNVSLVDVYPTLLELSGQAPPPTLDGRSLLSLVRGEPWSERTLFGHRRKRGNELEQFLWSAVRGRWKLIVDPTTDEVRLYDHVADPEELSDVAAEHPDVVAELTAARLAFLENRAGRANELVDVGVDSSLLEHLRDMGYAGEEPEEPEESE